MTRTPLRRGAIVCTVVPVRTSAPAAFASASCASIAGSTATNPPSGCTTPTKSSGNAKGRKPFHQRRRVQHFVRQTVRARREQRARHHRAVGRADLGDAGDVQERLPARRLELAPQLIGAAQQRHIGRMLEIAEPDDARSAVRGALIVARRKALDAEHARAAAREWRAPRCPWRRGRRRPRRISPSFSVQWRRAPHDRLELAGVVFSRHT